MPSMILTSTQLRRWRACKQGLAGKGFLDVLEAVGRVAGVYGTAPTCYLSLAARVAGFHRKDLDTELYTARRLVRLRCMRSSVYAVTLDQFPVVVGAMADRVERDLGRLVAACGITEEEVTAVAGRVLEVLANSEPLTVAELRVAGVSPSGWRREAFGFVIGLLCARRMLVRATVRGSWRSDNFAYARLSDWLPAHDLTAVAPEEARVRLARAYLRAYGPASLDDFQWWSGLTKTQARAAFTALAPEVEQIAGADRGFPLLTLADETDELRTANLDDIGVRLLPVWDSYLMGWRDRSHLIAAEEELAYIYDRGGNATSIVLVDGLALGIWELTEGNGIPTITVAGLDDRLASRWPEVEQAAEYLAHAMDLDTLRVVRQGRAGRLTDASQGAFQSPISRGRLSR